MKTGMLWFDDDPKRTLEEKLERAVKRFREKYGEFPNLCYGNPRTIEMERVITHISIHDELPLYNLRLKQARSILPNHFWIGIDPTVRRKHELVQ